VEIVRPCSVIPHTITAKGSASEETSDDIDDGTDRKDVIVPGGAFFCGLEFAGPMWIDGNVGTRPSQSDFDDDYDDDDLNEDEINDDMDPGRGSMPASGAGAGDVASIDSDLCSVPSCEFSSWMKESQEGSSIGIDNDARDAAAEALEARAIMYYGRSLSI